MGQSHSLASRRRIACGLLVLAFLGAAPTSYGGEPNEFTVKREQVYAFAEAPRVKREGDLVTISFAVTGACDVTVAVEDGDGRIVRHLASGVLGSNPPLPFKKDALSQTVVWEGKDDEGRYIDSKDQCSVRVSLGLKPEFERSLFWSPYKRISEQYPIIQAAPEGVYVFDGNGTDHIRLFDHEGVYLRTVYPFPAGKLADVRGLRWENLPGGGRSPLKNGGYLTTYLTSGESAKAKPPAYGLSGRAATTMSVREGNIYLSHLLLNRLGTDGSSGGMELTGPRTAVLAEHKGIGALRGRSMDVSPTSSSVSPDGRWLYLTGYQFRWTGYWDGLHGVMRMDLQKGTPPEPFLGSMKQGESGNDAAHFNTPTSIARDAQGQLYVSDYLNDRVQVFSADGKFVRSIPAKRPARVVIPQGRDELYVFSWPIWVNESIGAFGKLSLDRKRTYLAENTLTRMGPLSNPKMTGTWPLPLQEYTSFLGGVFRQKAPGPMPCWAEVDPWTDPPTIWLGPEKLWGLGWTKSAGQFPGQNATENPGAVGSWEQDAIQLLVAKEDKLEVKKDFGQEAKRMISRLAPAVQSRQRLYVNPSTGLLYMLEGEFFGLATESLLEIDPATDRQTEVSLPFMAEDLCFDLENHIFLRSATEVARYDFRTWREVPFDYGEEREKAHFGSNASKNAQLASAILLPCNSAVYRQGGMYYCPGTGHLLIGTTYYETPGSQLHTRRDTVLVSARNNYTRRIYPGRFIHDQGKAPTLHIFDKFGKLVSADVVPGLTFVNGVGLDKDDAVFVMMNGARMLNGQRYVNGRTDTFFKSIPGKTRVLAENGAHCPVPITEETKPKRPYDFRNAALGNGWIENAQWMYGGVGMASRGTGEDDAPGCCNCSNAKFAFDFFGRTFAPELDRCSVAVLDANGNLILHLGGYGNADNDPAKDRAPLSSDNAALIYPVYLGVHTDRRLFVADPGNARIVSVKLGYHEQKIIPLKSIRDEAQDGQ